MKNANTKSRASSVSKLRARLLKSWAAVIVLAASLLFIGLLTGCPNGSGPNRPNEPDQPPAKPVDPILKTDGHGKITGYKCAKEELPSHLVIPAKIGDEEIKEIGNLAFQKCKGLTTISLPASLTKIERRAFYGCTGLTSLTIDSANTKYKTEDNILYNKAGTILIFAAGGLTSANILNTVTTIGGDAVSGCTGLTSITLPANLTEIGHYAFSGCKGLTSAVFADKNNWKVYDDEAHTQNETEINSSDLDNAATAAKYLRESTYNGGYREKYWKKR